MYVASWAEEEEVGKSLNRGLPEADPNVESWVSSWVKAWNCLGWKIYLELLYIYIYIYTCVQSEQRQLLTLTESLLQSSWPEPLWTRSANASPYLLLQLALYLRAQGICLSTDVTTPWVRELIRLKVKL